MKQFTARSALLTLDGWNLVFHCPACGPHEKPGRSLMANTRMTVEIGKVLPRLRCPTCGAAPAKLEAVCVWALKYNRDPLVEDITDIAIGQPDLKGLAAA